MQPGWHGSIVVVTVVVTTVESVVDGGAAEKINMVHYYFDEVKCKQSKDIPI